MDAVDVKVLRALHAWRQEGCDALLVTVVRTWGSAPRPIGALLALRVGVEMVGSVSGGCIEDDLFARFQSIEGMCTPTLVSYGVSAEEAHRFGLPCGGTVELMVECNPCVQALQQLLAHLDSGTLVRRTVDVHSGHVTLAPVAAHAPLHHDGQRLSMTLGPQWRMLLIGAGVLSQYLGAMATSAGFAVTVCDPREEHALSWEREKIPLLTSMPDDAVIAFKPDANTCIITLSHDPKLDDMALMEALNSNAFYVGAIGSRKNNAARRERLAEHFDFSAQELARLHGPIGLFIGSKTPPEIAVSVLAEVIAVKNGVALRPEMQVLQGKTLHESACTLQA